MSNYISGALTREDQAQIAAAIATIREKLPFMLELPTKTKKGLPKMGDKSRAFVQAVWPQIAQIAADGAVMATMKGERDRWELRDQVPR